MRAVSTPTDLTGAAHSLPDLNFGTNAGTTCSPSIMAAVLGPLTKPEQPQEFSYVLNGRFKGGYQFRNSGEPGVIVLQSCKGDLSVEKWADICQTV